jgi:hypothetical protein
MIEDGERLIGGLIVDTSQYYQGSYFPLVDIIQFAVCYGKLGPDYKTEIIESRPAGKQFLCCFSFNHIYYHKLKR